MRPSTHYLAGFALGTLLADNPVELAACVLGAGIPDRLDIACSFGSRERWERIHRTWSHNASYWMLPVALWAAFWPFPTQPPWGAALEIAKFLMYGVLSHIVLDLLTPMGIGICPFASGSSRISLKMIRTNSLSDTLLGPALAAAAVLWRWREGFDARAFFGSVFGMWGK